jgi:endonuclease/exonuclease/phosphatase family metal-dependent hydrolase
MGQWIAAASVKHHDIIVMGDFNANLHDPTYNRSNRIMEIFNPKGIIVALNNVKTHTGRGCLDNIRYSILGATNITVKASYSGATFHSNHTPVRLKYTISNPILDNKIKYY